MRQQRLSMAVSFLAIVALTMVTLAACSDDDHRVIYSGSSPSTSSPPATEPSSPLSPPENPPPEVLTITSPVRLAAYNDVSFLVSDFNTNKVLIVDKTTLQLIAGFGVSARPTGLAFSGGNFYVASQGNGGVDVRDPQGVLLYSLGAGAGIFGQVNDLAVDESRGEVYVLDTAAARIKVFRTDGTDLGVTLGAGILLKPTALTLDPATGNLLVSDFGTPGNARVWILSPAGVQLGSISGKAGGMLGAQIFSTPQGLFVDSAGYLFLVDARSGEVQIFNLSTKAKIKTLGGLGTGVGELFYPLDVLVDETTKDVFVADYWNQRIAVFQGGGVVP